ncbi:16S rRNA (guanine(966)-N(2))-methyltransferase [Desulfonema limicola]|uniref:16S rRNA (Guanine(966)-N(2))-methyltransferase n=1 Tax=Desulfonema limicola TaxID=45656 RepID=A0A975BCR5_9BACT|nr:16S rRNA (guanine(966)-N(2))-methyltransferase RsmD [Desulfonema limicola]QTA82981.1 16S rRNA (guanine(966)-N(2))-methyltransferase [Desulfonema limicola]
MRIIAGNLKGRKLNSVKGNAVRPTSDRMRESIFNILSRQVRHAVVLELFAGTGAMGIEAMSRGAASAVFIDKYKEALLTINKNIQTCRLGDKTRVISWDIAKNLKCLDSYDPCFNLVFMDPPYNKNLIKPGLKHICKSRSLAPEAVIVLEHSKDELIPEDISGLSVFDQRKYGKNLVSFICYDMTEL